MSIKISCNEIFLFCMAVHLLEHSSDECGEQQAATSAEERAGDARELQSKLQVAWRMVLLFIYMLGFPLPVLQRDRMFSVVILPQFVCR